jgi:hypothetical protein
MLQSLPPPPPKPKEEYNSAAFGRADVMCSLRVTWPPIWRLVLYQFSAAVVVVVVVVVSLFFESERGMNYHDNIAACCRLLLLLLLLPSGAVLCSKFRFLVGPESRPG